MSSATSVTPPLTEDRILTLWQAYKATGANDLREQIILHYAPVVKKVVGRMGLNVDGVIEWGDLINYGVMGLIDAIERYEPDRGVAFQTFASLRIRGAVLDALRQFDPLGRQARRRVREAKEAVQRLTMTLGRPPEDEEVAVELSLSLEQYQQVLQDANFVLLSLDQPLQDSGDEQNLQLADLLEDPSAGEPLDRLEEADLQERLMVAIQTLPRREQILLSLYYYEDLTMREVATVMEISQTRVCQLHARAILSLKSILFPSQPVEKTGKDKEDDFAVEPSHAQSNGREPALHVADKRRTSYRARKYWSQIYNES
jgi:RNA polymerase sigma factor for flagellar operon FliA